VRWVAGGGGVPGEDARDARGGGGAATGWGL
jgi:hypothetical protein